MVTSGSYSFQMTRNEVILEALSLIGVAGAFRNPSAEEYATGAKWLNILIKAWQKKGLRPTQQTQAVIFLDTVNNKYTLGPNGTHASYTYAQTELDGDQLAGATTIDVLDVDGIAAGYPIGIEIDTETMQWTTVVSVVGLTITLTDPLDENVTSGGIIYAYPEKIQKPLRFNNCQRALPDGTEAIVGIENRSDYFNISNKTIKGYVTQLHYSPKINDGELYVFPISSQCTQVLKATIEYPLEVFTSSTQTLPFPAEWCAATIYGLAALIAPIFGFFGPEYESVKAMAGQLEEDVLGTDVEDNYIQFLPDTDGNCSY